MAQLDDIARNVITSSTYMTVATSSNDRPWASTLFFGIDKSSNFYFVSGCKTLHVQNIIKNPQVAVSIFDSHAIPGAANGVQIDAVCRRLTGKEIQTGIDAIYSKRYPDPKERLRHKLSVARFDRSDDDPSHYHIYMIEPKHIFILNKEVGEDTRQEVFFH